MQETRPIRWGILGTGRIAEKFAADLALLPDAHLVAVGSRTREAAEAFGEAWHAPRCHATYEALAADPEVEVIYIATPHALHRDNVLLCLREGKAVLCEKAFTLWAGQAEEVIAEARTRGLFLMEAMWTRFLPLMGTLRDLLADGAIGDLQMLSADFGFRVPFDPHSRLFDPGLGGGALLDVGVYPLSFASWLFGTPAHVTGVAHLGETGVDEQCAIALGYASGQVASLSAAVRTATPIVAQLFGTEGTITLHTPWYKPTRLTLARSGQELQTIEQGFDGSGYQFEAAEVGRCLRAGLLESPTMPLDETLTIMYTMDQLRAGWGQRYPGEA